MLYKIIAFSDGVPDIDTQLKIAKEKIIKKGLPFEAIISFLRDSPDKIKFINLFLSYDVCEVTISQGLSYVNDSNVKYLAKLLKDGRPGLIHSLPNLNNENEALLQALLDARSGSLPGSNIAASLETVNSVGIKWLDILDPYRDSEIYECTLLEIVRNIDSTNEIFLDELLQISNKCETSRDRSSLYRNIPVYLSAYSKFIDFAGVSDISSLSLPQKIRMLKVLVNTRSSSYGHPLKEKFPLLPQTRLEYYNLIDKLNKSISAERMLSFGTKEELFKSLDSQHVEFDSNIINVEHFNSSVAVVAENSFFPELNTTDKRIVMLALLTECIEGDDFEKQVAIYCTLNKFEVNPRFIRKIHDVLEVISLIRRGLIVSEQELNDLAFACRNANVYDLVMMIIGDSIPGEQNESLKLKIQQLKSTQVFMPQTRIPKASHLKHANYVEADGIFNIIINLGKNPNLEKMGFDKGVEVYDLMGLVYAFNEQFIKEEDDYLSRSAIVMAGSNLFVDQLSSVSFIDYQRGAQNYRAFGDYGLLLDVDSLDIHGGHYMDMFSGYRKNYQWLKESVLFDNDSPFRSYYSEELKTVLGFRNEEYVQLMKTIGNCSTLEEVKSLVSKDIFEKIDLYLKLMKRSVCKVTHKVYNEIFVSNAKIQAVFVQNRDSSEVPETPFKLRKFAAENDLPIIVFSKPRSEEIIEKIRRIRGDIRDFFAP